MGIFSRRSRTARIARGVLLILPFSLAAYGQNAGTPRTDAGENIAARFETDAAQWQKVLADANDLCDRFSIAAKDKGADYVKFGKDHRKATAARERELEDWRIALERRIHEDGESERISEDAVVSRIGYVESVFRVRMVYIYGYLVPAAIAEFEKNWDWKDGPSGPEKVTEEDFRRVQDALIGRSSMPRDDFGGKPWIK